MNEPIGALIEVYEAASRSWMAGALGAGSEIFRRLAALEIVVFGLIVALKGQSAAAVFPELVWKLLLIALMLTALLFYPVWMPALVPSFAAIAEGITGFGSLEPADVVAQGVSLTTLMLLTSATSGLIFGDLLGALLGGISAFGILLSFVAMAAILTRTLIESWIVLSVGPIFLGFAPFRLTAQLADNFVVWAFGVGIKLFFLLLLVAAASEVAVDWALILISPRDGLGPLFEILAGSIILAVSLWTIPTKLADTLTRGWSLGLRRGLGS